MKSTFFIDKHLVRELEKDVKKRASLQEKEREHIKKFEQQVDRQTITELFNHIKSYGYEKDKDSVNKLEGKLDSINFTSEDALEVLDLYEIYIERMNEK